MALKKKNLIFDLGGVLLNIYPQRTFEAFAAMGIDRSLLTEKYTLSNKVMLDFEQGDISPDELCAYIKELLPSNACPLSIEQLKARIMDAWCALIGELPLYKWQRLVELRRNGYNIFLLSNTNAIHWERISQDISQLQGLPVEKYFDKIFLSYEMHLCKPSEEIFNRVLADIGISAADAIFFDDSPANCAAAEKVGMETVLIDRNSQWTDKLLKD